MRRLSASACCGDAQAQHLDLAGAGLQQAAQHADGGGLARAIGSEEAVDLRARDLHVEAIDRDQGAEATGQPAGDDRDVAGAGGARRPRGRGRRGHGARSSRRRLGRQPGRQGGGARIVQREFRDPGQAAGVVAGQGVVGRETGVAADPAHGGRQLALDAFDVHAELRAHRGAGAHALGHVDAHEGAFADQHREQGLAHHHLVADPHRDRIDAARARRPRGEQREAQPGLLVAGLGGDQRGLGLLDLLDPRAVGQPRQFGDGGIRFGTQAGIVGARIVEGRGAGQAALAQFLRALEVLCRFGPEAAGAGEAGAGRRHVLDAGAVALLFQQRLQALHLGRGGVGGQLHARRILRHQRLPGLDRLALVHRQRHHRLVRLRGQRDAIPFGGAQHRPGLAVAASREGAQQGDRKQSAHRALQ